MQRYAFTLIEVTAGLVLVGLMAAAAALALGSAYRGAQLEDVTARIAALDDTARRTAETTGTPGTIYINPVSGRLWFTHTDTSEARLPQVVLPRGFTLSRVDAGLQRTDDSALKVPCSRHGHTPSYTLTLTDPGGQTRRLVFAGLSGQLTLLEDNEDFDINKMRTSRPDAD